jgi:hypothetical protein
MVVNSERHFGADAMLSFKIDSQQFFENNNGFEPHNLANTIIFQIVYVLLQIATINLIEVHVILVVSDDFLLLSFEERSGEEKLLYKS